MPKKHESKSNVDLHSDSVDIPLYNDRFPDAKERTLPQYRVISVETSSTVPRRMVPRREQNLKE